MRAKRTKSAARLVKSRGQERGQQDLEEDDGEEDGEAGRETRREVGEDIAHGQEDALGPPLREVDREQHGRKAHHGGREQGDEEDEGGQLGRENRPQANGQGRQVDEVPAVGKEDVPFEQGDDAEDQHHQGVDVVLLLPGAADVGHEVVLEEHQLGRPEEEDGQKREGDDELLLHLVLEIDRLVAEHPAEEMPGQEGELPELGPQSVHRPKPFPSWPGPAVRPPRRCPRGGRAR